MVGGQFPGLAFTNSEDLKAERANSPTLLTPTRREMKPRAVTKLAPGHIAKTGITVFFPLGNLNIVTHPTVDRGRGPAGKFQSGVSQWLC